MKKDTYDIMELVAELTEDEGRERKPYSDTKGYLSIGIGRNLTGKGLSEAEIDYLFANDVDQCAAILDTNLPWWRTLSAGRQRVMINLCFMGWGSFSLFRKFHAAMQAGDWPVAVAELQDSRWWGQVGTRGPRVAERIIKG